MGDEFGNSQQGNNNPYCQDNKITWLNWQDREKNAELLNFWKQMDRFPESSPDPAPCRRTANPDSLSCVIRICPITDRMPGGPRQRAITGM